MTPDSRHTWQDTGTTTICTVCQYDLGTRQLGQTADITAGTRLCRPMFEIGMGWDTGHSTADETNAFVILEAIEYGWEPSDLDELRTLAENTDRWTDDPDDSEWLTEMSDRALDYLSSYCPPGTWYGFDGDMGHVGCHVTDELPELIEQIAGMEAHLTRLRAERSELITAYSQAGMSLRDIADMAGISHTRVAQLIEGT